MIEVDSSIPDCEFKPLTGLAEIANYLGLSKQQHVLNLIHKCALPAIYVPGMQDWITNSEVLNKWLIAASRVRLDQKILDSAIKRIEAEDQDRNAIRLYHHHLETHQRVISRKSAANETN